MRRCWPITCCALPRCYGRAGRRAPKRQHDLPPRFRSPTCPIQGRSGSAPASRPAAEPFTAKLAAPDELHKLSIRFLVIDGRGRCAPKSLSMVSRRKLARYPESRFIPVRADRRRPLCGPTATMPEIWRAPLVSQADYSRSTRQTRSTAVPVRNLHQNRERLVAADPTESKQDARASTEAEGGAKWLR